VLVYIP